MSLESVVPTALIRQLQISLRESFSLPSSDPSSAPAPPPFPSIQDAVASLDPSLDDSARCGRCRGGLLCGGVSRLCVYCGEGFKGGEAAPHEISFAATRAYKLLLESLGLDGSEAVNLDPDSVEPNKERDSSKSGMILSDLLDIKLVFSPITTYATDTETETKSEPVPTTYDLNLPGIDLDAVFKETKKEAPQIKNTKVTQNQVPFGNQTSAMSSFAKWEPDFGSQPVNPSLPIQIPVPVPENLSKTNPKKEVSEIETQVDEEFDDWRDFAGSRAAQNMSDSVEKAGPSVASREPVKAEGGNLFGLKNVASSGLDQSGLSDPEEVTKTSPEDSLPIENRESLNADEEDLCDDWEGFTSSGRGEEGLSGAVKPESGLPEQVPVRNVEPLNHEDDLIDDSKNFTGPGVAQTGFSVHEGKTAPISGDLFTINMEKEAAHTEMLHGDADDSFDEWNDFAGSGLGQSRSSGVEEKSKSTFWDPLNPKKLEETGNMETFNADDVEPFDDWKHSRGSGVTHIKFSSPEENIQPSSQDQSSVNEIGPSDRAEILHVKFNDPFDDWKDFTDSSAVQAKLPDNGEEAEPISDAPLLISTREQPSDNIGTSNINDDDSFDVWKDFTSSSAVQSGLPDAGEKNESGMGNSSDIFNVRPIGGAESMKDGGSIDLWSASVIGGVTNGVSNNGNTELSDGLLDFVRPSQVNGTVSIQEVKINNNDEDSSDNWLDFAAITGPTKTKSENLNLEKKGPDDLFDDWQAFTGSSQSVKPNSNPTEKESKFGELNHEDLSEDWLDFTGSSELKRSPELKAKNNGVSDGWSNFTHTNDERPESKSLSDDWQDFTSTGQVSAPVAYNAQDIDFGDFIQLSSSAGPTDHVNFDSLNGGHSDPPSFLPMPSNNILNLNSNSTVNSRTENVSDIQKFLSQMSDLSFMLKDELSIPDKPDPK